MRTRSRIRSHSDALGRADGRKARSPKYRIRPPVRKLTIPDGFAHVLVSTGDECAATGAVRDRAGTPTEVLHGDHIGFDVLAGVAALASVCAWRDTGLMHLAAALGRPVLVVMGGGHWG